MFTTCLKSFYLTCTCVGNVQHTFALRGRLCYHDDRIPLKMLRILLDVHCPAHVSHRFNRCTNHCIHSPWKSDGPTSVRKHGLVAIYSSFLIFWQAFGVMNQSDRSSGAAIEVHLYSNASVPSGVQGVSIWGPWIWSRMYTQLRWNIPPSAHGPSCRDELSYAISWTFNRLEARTLDYCAGIYPGLAANSVHISSDDSDEGYP
jgi:hypothetical protein